MRLERHYVECDCRDPDHHLVLDYYPEDGELLIYNRLRHYQPWWKRLVTAFNYVTGRDVKKIDYTEVFIDDPEEITKFRDFLSHILENRK